MAQQTVNQSVRSPDLTEAFDLCEVAPAAVLHVFFMLMVYMQSVNVGLDS